MSKIGRRNLVVALILTMCALASPLSAADKTEDQLIAELASPMEGKVTSALLELEKRFPTSTKAFPDMKKLLTDPREKVRRKAARVLGVLHADVNQTDLDNICAMLKAADPQEVMDALKSLRGLKAQSTMPLILPLLQNANIGVMRDACRTIAVLGTSKDIPAIEPLLKHPDTKVQKDAHDAIFALKAKS